MPAQHTQSNTRQRLLIVEDDIKYCRLIVDYLQRFGFEVKSVHDGESALKVSAMHEWDAIILDVMLPGLGGLDVLRRLRNISHVPVVMLTALADEPDRIVGLEMGADDYVPKTSSPRELLARLRAVLRRASYAPAAAADGTEIVIGPLHIKLLSREITMNDLAVSLTPAEFELLVALAQAKGRIKTREQLLNDIKDRDFDACDRAVDVHVSALRKKLGDDPKNPWLIRTVRSIGYSLVDPSQEQDSRPGDGDRAGIEA